MTVGVVHILVSLVLAGLVMSPAGAAADEPAFTEVAATPAHLARLREGGFVLYVRHGLTDTTRPDRVPSIDLRDCRTQRPLSEGGRLMAVRIGEMIRQAALPVGRILASPLCRTRDTAAGMFPGRKVEQEFNLRYLSNMTAADKGPVIETTRILLSQAPQPGTNTVLVAHGPNLAELTGYFPADGTVAIFRPKGSGQFEYVASIPPGLWNTLLP